MRSKNALKRATETLQNFTGLSKDDAEKSMRAAITAFTREIDSFINFEITLTEGKHSKKLLTNKRRKELKLAIYDAIQKMQKPKEFFVVTI